MGRARHNPGATARHGLREQEAPRAPQFTANSPATCAPPALAYPAGPRRTGERSTRPSGPATWPGRRQGDRPVGRSGGGRLRDDAHRHLAEGKSQECTKGLNLVAAKGYLASADTFPRTPHDRILGQYPRTTRLMTDRVAEVRESLQDCCTFEGEPGRGRMATVYLRGISNTSDR